MHKQFYNPDIMSPEEETAWKEADKRYAIQKKEREETTKILKNSDCKQKETIKT